MMKMHTHSTALFLLLCPLSLLSLWGSLCEAAQSLESFCAVRPAGLYCHPENGKQRVYCPDTTPTSKPDPFLVPCPGRHVCRSHRKLHLVGADPESQHEPNSLLEGDQHLVHYPQCVFAEYTDLDAFCEDKINEFVNTHRSQGTDDRRGSSSVVASEPDSLEQQYSSLLSPPSEQDGSRATHGRLMKNLLEKSKSSLNLAVAWNEVELAVRQCNPFNALRKQVLDCVVIRRECGVDLKDVLNQAGNANASEVSPDVQLPAQTCIPTKEIKLFVEDCPTFDVCRKYDQEDGSENAKCIPPVNAMCMDRLWSFYAKDIISKSKMERNDPTAAVHRDETTEDSWTNELLEFRFCDPFKPRLQLECIMNLRVYRKPLVRSNSMLVESDRAILTSRIQTQFPILHSLLFPSSHSSNSPSTADDGVETYTEPLTNPSISVRAIRVNRHSCSADTVRQGDKEGATRSYEDPWLVHEGPVCRQLSQKLSRCMPRVMLDIPTSRLENNQFIFTPTGDDTEDGDDGAATKEIIVGLPVSGTGKTKAKPPPTIHLSSDSPIMKPESYMGFCLGKGKPGQYCVPGTPEIAVLCPQGKVLNCPRPRWGDHAAWTDLGSESERCVQMLGDIPGQGGNPPPEKHDFLRETKIVDIFGNELTYGWWAKCEAVA